MHENIFSIIYFKQINIYRNQFTVVAFKYNITVKCFLWIYCFSLHVFTSLTCVCQRPGSVYEDDVRRQQHYEDAVGQSDQSAVPLGPPMTEGPIEQHVEAEPANQAKDHLQYRHGSLYEMISFILRS